MKKILVVNVNWLGDVIFSSPVFKSLHNAYPDSKIDCLAVDRVHGILKCIRYVDDIITYREKNLFSFFSLILKLRKKKYDCVFFLSRSRTRVLLTKLAGIPQRIGCENKGRGKNLTHIVQEKSGLVHRSDYYLQVIESFGVKVKDRSTSLEINEDQRDITTILQKNNCLLDQQVVLINPGGNWDLKRWPPLNFTKLTNLLIEDLGKTCVFVGASKDVQLVDQILSHVKQKDKVVNLVGQTNLEQILQIMQKAPLVVSADSGPLHMASSVGTATVGVFGPTRPEITGPRGSGESTILQKQVGCNLKACYFLECPDNICMQAVSVQEVYETIKQITNK